MKKELLTLVAGSAMFASFANAEIVLTDDLSAYGYIDMAFTDSDGSVNTESGVAEFELGFAFTPAESAWSAVAELSFRNGQNSYNDGQPTDVDFETVTITYAYSDELSFTAGNMLTYQGFETYDATGLYQFSYQGIDGLVYSAAYAPGASVDYVTDAYAFGAWVGDTADADQSYEFLAAYTGVEGLTAKFIYANDPGYETFNFWAAYDVDAFTFVVEYTNDDQEMTETGDSEVFMALVYYAMGDAGLTVRYSGGEDTGVDFDKYTISPSYAFSDNVFGLLEASYLDLDNDSDTQLAAELIFSF